MNTIERLRSNVNKNYIFTFLTSFNLTRGIWMLYLASKGLNLLEIGLMESVYHITSFTMEIPTGIIADLYGRKTSRILGQFAGVISIIVMLLSNNVFLFALSFILTALGNNLESGAGEALIYDSLKEIKEEDRFMKVKGKQEIFFQGASSIALILGGYLGTINYNYVYIVAMVFSIITLLQTLTFVEPSIGKIEKIDSKRKIFINQFITSIKVIRGDFRIAFLIIAMELFGTFVTTEFFYIQNYLKSIGRNELQIGIILSIGALAAAVAATNAYRIENRFGFKGLLTVMPLLGIVSFWGFTIQGLTEIFFVLITTIESILFVITSDYINRLIPSEQRATILSFQSMAFSLFMILLFPVVGKMGDLYGLLQAFRLIAVVSTIILVVVIAIVHLNKKVVVERHSEMK